jgi:valyl-tRNA synthetase
MEQRELPKTYNAQDWEDSLYQTWLESGFFNPDVCIEKGVTSGDAEPFSMVLPPPNATGTLHTGSACMLAIEDTIVRFARMQGKRTLWLPGTDHAAIATQSKVERILWEEEGLTRYDLGRDALIEKINLFVQQNQETMLNQMRKMGASLDWSREAFTLDAKRHQAVNRAFKTMYDEGLIVRGDRIVNWDPKGQTTISDDEVVYQEEVAKLYYLKYGPFEIATARPETKFGDKYVVMHPDDTRYVQYAHGQKLTLEWINGSIETTVIKDTSIDMAFGTGVMTITPWHSVADFDIAERHNLDKEQIIDQSGKLLSIAGEFEGLHIRDARERIIAKLESKGLVTKVEDNYVHQIATAERTGETIEPQIMRQWFILVNKEFERNGTQVTLKSLMQSAVADGGIAILPERFHKTYFQWIDNLRDWCISRQIWYGHRIPVYYRGDEVLCSETAPADEGWEQDSDTLDTWFSSGLWTFSTLGWGSDEEQWAREKIYHPTALIESGYDILFFWIARMVLMSQYLLDEVPFRTIYLHGLVRDAEGRKMSKSLDNILDPLEVIKDYGTDALRLALISGNTPGNDARLSDEKLIAQRNFVNKLWNMSRYVFLLEETALTNDRKNSLADEYILMRLSTVTESVTTSLESYQLSFAVDLLRDFTVNSLADWYIEIHKIEKNNAVLKRVMTELIKLWHPFMPFVTEAIWTHFDQERLLLVTKWPHKNAEKDFAVIHAFESIQTLITRVRNIRATYRIGHKAPLEATLFTANPELFEDNRLLIEKMSSLDLTLATEEPGEIARAIRLVEADFTLYLNLKDIIDFSAEQDRLIKELAEA